MTPSAYNTNVHLFQTPDYWPVSRGRRNTSSLV